MTDHATFAVRAGTPYPARSKMLDMYTGDIARMLMDGKFEAAEQTAVSIPHVAVALTDAALQSSSAAYQEWCTKWVQPDFGAAAYKVWCAKSKEAEHDGVGVPFIALRTLRLQRRARELPTPILEPQPGAVDPHSSQGVTCALLGAICRWFEQEGRHQQIVQTNLARLGVLR